MYSNDTPFTICQARIISLDKMKAGPEVIQVFFMLSSAENEILNAHKYKNINKFSFFQAQISL